MNIQDKSFLIISNNHVINQYKTEYGDLYDLESRVEAFHRNKCSVDDCIGYFNNEKILKRKFDIIEAIRILKLEKI